MRRALVTGGSGGIGAAICRALSSRNFEVIVHANRNLDVARALADELTAAGGSAKAVAFDVTDGTDTAAVSYVGILPDLFREGSGVVAEGRMERGRFVADTILAKHDERYMPPQMGNQAAEHAVATTLKK